MKKFTSIVFIVTVVLLPSTLYAQGQIDNLLVIREGDTPRIKEAKRILQGNPTGTQRDYALYGLGHANVQIGRYREAIKVYRHMMNIDVQWNPHFVPSDMAVALRRLGRMEEARKMYNKTLEMHEDFGHAHYGLAQMEIRQDGDYEDALRRLKIALENEPISELHNPIRVQIAAAKLGLGQPREAIQQLKKLNQEMSVTMVAQNFPVNDVESLYELRYYLGRAYYKIGEYKKARKWYQKVIDAYHTRREAPNQGRTTIMPSGEWEMIEHPDAFRHVFQYMELP